METLAPAIGAGIMEKIMRILHRSMLRYGGPIKEGVMHGMIDGGSITGSQRILVRLWEHRTGFKNP